MNTPPCVFLESSTQVAMDLDHQGWHRGNWRDDYAIDQLVSKSVASGNMHLLNDWYPIAIQEAREQGKACACLFHPLLTLEQIRSTFIYPMIPIQSWCAEEAAEKLRLVRSVSLRPPKPVRNLIYHIWPRKGNGVWQWNVRQLIERIEQFDGVRSIGVVLDATTDSIEDVRAMFSGHRIDHWIVENNNPDYGEMVTIRQLLNTLPKDQGITFYAHSKGARYEHAELIKEWARIGYSASLDWPYWVASVLEEHPCAGPFFRTDSTGWYYSGTFFWFRNQDVFARPNAYPDGGNRWGVEMWLRNLFSREEAGRLIGNQVGHLYDPNALAPVQRMHDWWKKIQPNVNAVSPSISVIIPTLGRPWIRRMIESLLVQIGSNDEIIVVADGSEAHARAIEYCVGLPVIISEASNPQSVYGNHQRNLGVKMAVKDVLWFCDDDDLVPPYAMAKIRQVMAKDMRPTMFRQNHQGVAIWQSKQIVDSQVSSTQMLMPNVPDILPFPVPTFPDRGSDLRWIQEINSKSPINWEESIIYVCEQSRFGRFE
jgi:hypothetical protein